MIETPALYPSLRYISTHRYSPNELHPVLRMTTLSYHDCLWLPTKCHLLLGTYTLQSNRAKFNQFHNPTCLLCKVVHYYRVFTRFFTNVWVQKLSPRSVRERERCSLIYWIMSVCVCVCLSVIYRSQFFTDLNNIIHKNSIGDREEPYCLVTF